MRENEARQRQEAPIRHNELSYLDPVYRCQLESQPLYDLVLKACCAALHIHAREQTVTVAQEHCHLCAHI